MQQGGGSFGHRKHRQAFGKTNRNPTNNMRAAADLNHEHDEVLKRKERLKGTMYGSVSELMRTRR